MSKTAQIVMWLIVAAVVVAMLKNAAGTVGIMLAGGTETANILGTLEGTGTKQNSTGTFKSGTTSIKLG